MSDRSGENGTGKPTILEEIAAKTRLRVEQAKAAVPLKAMQEKAESVARGAGVERESFARALGQRGLSAICEVKKASPSKGLIAEDFPWLEIAQEYEAAGAAAISVLTEPDYFLGANLHLQQIAATVSVPVLRKDFIVDPYQLYEAVALGADAVLLICALLSKETLASYIAIAGSLGISALVEAHTLSEAEQAAAAGARIIGINNRDLNTFAVDIEASARLRNSIPPGILAVAESGIKSPEDIRILDSLQFDAVLIGESLMRSADKKRFLAELMAPSVPCGGSC